MESFPVCGEPEPTNEEDQQDAEGLRRLRISRYGFYKPREASTSQIQLMEYTIENDLNTTENLPKLVSMHRKKRKLDKVRKVVNNPLYDIPKPLNRNRS